MRFLTAIVCSTVLTGCAIPKPGPFYQQAARPDAAAGTLLATAPYPAQIKGAAAYRVIYNSEDINGAIIPVSGVIYVPLAPPPPGGRNTVAWAHATTGVAPGCAPSVEPDSLAGSIPGLADFIAAGDVVAATDYQGMGIDGVHPYLVGKSEGQTILDSVRAAKNLPGASMNGNFVVWGHSQGGQAALFAGELAASYAPSLHLLGVAAAAPPTDMKGELTAPFTNISGRLLAAYVYHTWSITYHVPMTTVVYPDVVPIVNNTAGKCLDSLGQAIDAILTARRLEAKFLENPPQTTPPWPPLFNQNSPGHMPPGAPLLITQGLKDPTVEPHWTETFAANACARHETLDFQELPGVNHLRVAYKSLPIVLPWVAARFAGSPAPSNCK